MACHISCLADVRQASVRPGALALAVLAGFLALPGASYAECVERMSRMPISSPAAGAAPAYRANMMRRAPAARPAAAAARPKATKAKATGGTVRKARPVHKASVHRPARKGSPRIRRAAAPTVAPVFRAMPTPTPMPVAARELATPRAYALIATTVCETGPQALGAPDLGVPVLAIAPGGGGGPGDGFIPGTDTETVLPPIIGPDFPDAGPTGPTGGVPGVVPPPGVEPPVTGPPVVEPPIVPPGEEPPVVPPGEEPPILPPTGPPVVEPPIDNPIVVPPTTPVPEPATWALMIVGFGLLGARLRATSSAASGSPGRAGRRG
jgi:hypothetical protein